MPTVTKFLIVVAAVVGAYATRSDGAAAPSIVESKSQLSFAEGEC